MHDLSEHLIWDGGSNIEASDEPKIFEKVLQKISHKRIDGLIKVTK